MLSMAVWVQPSRECQEIWVHLVFPPCSLCLLVNDGRFLILRDKEVIIFLLDNTKQNLSVSIFCVMSKR